LQYPTSRTQDEMGIQGKRERVHQGSRLPRPSNHTVIALGVAEAKHRLIDGRRPRGVIESAAEPRVLQAIDGGARAVAPRQVLGRQQRNVDTEFARMNRLRNPLERRLRATHLAVVGGIALAAKRQLELDKVL